MSGYSKYRTTIQATAEVHIEGEAWASEAAGVQAIEALRNFFKGDGSQARFAVLLDDGRVAAVRLVDFDYGLVEIERTGPARLAPEIERWL